MIDHVSISVQDYEASLKFYDETLKLLGYDRILTMEQVKVAGYGKDGRPNFWISPMGNDDEAIGKARGVHFAFIAPSIEAVNQWYKKCLELGGVDNGAPGSRAEYHPQYYGAFIIDPNGWRIEACMHDYKS
jgi:catechol 2,3-dioxygenase-like lactoylglutathione lyase family enzyme